jgi:hypothetical protein
VTDIERGNPVLQTIFGLPIHPLIVHATVVVVPAAALAVLLAAVSPRFRSWAGVLVPVLALAAVVLTPLSTSSGEALQGMVGDSHLVEEHSELADMLIWWVIPLLVGAAGVWWFNRRGVTARRGLMLAAGVLSVVAAVGTTVQVVLIGHSGAEAAWHGVAAQTSASGGDGD